MNDGVYIDFGGDIVVKYRSNDRLPLRDHKNPNYLNVSCT